MRYLNMIAQSMTQENKEAPLDKALVDTLHRLQAQRQWKWSTTLKAAASTQGALSLLPLYRAGVSRIILTRDSVIWSTTMRRLGQLCREEKPTQPHPATFQQIQQAVDIFRNMNRPDITTALLLGWITASRLGCVLQLHKEDVTFNENHSLSITFRRGKGVKARGPYTVHAPQVPTCYYNMLKEYCDTRRTLIFPSNLKGDHLCSALRQVATNLEQRSIRRGALQAMARANVSEETLMRFSGHTQVSTLHRYLNWNAVNSKVAKEMQGAGRVLVQQ